MKLITRYADSVDELLSILRKECEKAHGCLHYESVSVQLTGRRYVVIMKVSDEESPDGFWTATSFIAVEGEREISKRHRRSLIIEDNPQWETAGEPDTIILDFILNEVEPSRAIG